MVTCKWLGLDLSPLVLDAPYKTCRAEPAIADSIAHVKLGNPNGFFSEGEGGTLLADTPWQGSKIEIGRDGETVLEGIVTDAAITRADCTLDVQSPFSRAFKRYCDAELLNKKGGLDPASAIRALCDSAGMGTDAASFASAGLYLRNRGVLCNAIASRQYKTPLLEAVNALLEMGCLRAWVDDRLRVLHPPCLLPGASVLRIRAADILGDIKYGTKPRAISEYSIGYLGDSCGALPVRGDLSGVLPADREPPAGEVWTQSYNAQSQWQLIDGYAAYALGMIKLGQERRRRTAAITVRDNFAPLSIGAVYEIAPWGGSGWLAGYEKKQGSIDLYFEEALPGV